MRTIKFRAQDIASNKWLYGDIRHHKNDVCIFEQGGNRGEQVKPETVGQFTGLHDKNGKEIYEGDIIRHKDMVKPYHVIYDGHQFAPNDGWRSLSYPKHWEVVGNVFDDPGLAEKGGEQ